MQDIYEEKKTLFDRMPHLAKTINDLRDQLKSVHKKCAQLIPPTSERKRDRFKLVFYSFWSREKVEKLISDLYEHVDRCSQQFILLSSFRTEALVVEIHETLHHAVQSNSNHVMRNTVNTGYSNFAETGPVGSTISNAHLFEFTRSAAMPMTWIADTIPVHDLSRAYLRRELGKISLSLHSIFVRWLENPTSSAAPATGPDTGVGLPVMTISWFLDKSPMPSSLLHQDAVSLAFRIQSLLRESPNDVWMHTVDIAINQLSLDLNDLRMHEDAIAICNLRVDLWRGIAARYPSPTSSRRLVDALIKIAVVYSNMGDQSRTYLMAEEIIQILGSLVALGEQEPNMRLRLQDIEHLAPIMILQAENEQDAAKALQLAVDAGKMLEDALGLDHLSATDIFASASAALSIPSATGVLKIFHEVFSDDSRFTYASSLLHIAQIQLIHYQPVESNKFAKMSLAILNRLLATYPGSDKIQEEITKALAHLSSMKMRTLNTAAENLEYTEQNTALIRQLGQINPQRYVIPLASALWSQREALLVLSRGVEAQKIYQEMVSMSELAATPAHLDLKIPSQTEGDYYYQVALYHHATQRFQEAIYAAQNAVSQYSTLEFMEPGRSRAKHVSALALLCKSLTAARQYDTALLEGFKGLRIIDNNANILSAEYDLIESYRELLGALMEALEGSSEPGALALAEDIIARIRKLARSGKLRSKWKSAQAAVKYAKILQKNGMIEEVVKFLQEIRNNWREMFGDLNDTVTAVPYIQCLMELPGILKAKGETDKALDYNEEAIAFTEQFFGDAPDEFKSVVLEKMKSTHVYLLCDAGRYRDAMELSQKLLADIRRNPQTMLDSMLVIQALFGVALTQLYNCLPNDAIATTTEAVSLCQATESPHKFTLLYACLVNMSSAHADLGNIDEAITHLDRAENAILRQNQVYSMEELEGSGESAYGTILIKRSKMLFAKGDYAQAAALAKKVEAIERENAKMTKSSLNEVANVLIYSGVLYCTLGRHEEGIAAAAELKEIQESLADTSPALARLVKVGLNYLTKRGGWKPVQEAKDKLTCGHQDHQI